MQKAKCGFRCGHTLIELTVGGVISLIVILAAGILLVSGNHAWLRTYDSANKQIKQDSLMASIAFGTMGRRANRLRYTLYKFHGGTLEPALPTTSDPEEIVWGDAVEFRYWNVPLDATDSHNVMDTTTIATAYALFYLADGELRIDYGPYPPGAAPEGGGPKNTTGVTTRVLAKGASTEDERGAFSHTTTTKPSVENPYPVGEGAVRIGVVLTDPRDGDTVEVMTATLLRNVWPR